MSERFTCLFWGLLLGRIYAARVRALCWDGKAGCWGGERGHRASESAAAARGGSGHRSSSSTPMKAARRHREGKPESKTDWERKGRGSGRGGDQAHLLPEMNEEARASKQHHRREENKILSFFFPSLNHLKVLLASHGRELKI